MREYDKQTVITIDWYKRGGGHGTAVDTSGDKMPREIRASLVNTLLRELRGVEVRVGR